MWVASNYEKHNQELNMCDERQRALEAAMKSLKEAAEAERVNAQVELQAVNYKGDIATNRKKSWIYACAARCTGSAGKIWMDEQDGCTLRCHSDCRYRSNGIACS